MCFKLHKKTDLSIKLLKDTHFHGGLTLEAFNLKIFEDFEDSQKNQHVGCREKFFRTEHDMIIK